MPHLQDGYNYSSLRIPWICWYLSCVTLLMLDVCLLFYRKFLIQSMIFLCAPRVFDFLSFRRWDSVSASYGFTIVDFRRSFFFHLHGWSFCSRRFVSFSHFYDAIVWSFLMAFLWHVLSWLAHCQLRINFIVILVLLCLFPLHLRKTSLWFAGSVLTTFLYKWGSFASFRAMGAFPLSRFFCLVGVFSGALQFLMG